MTDLELLQTDLVVTDAYAAGGHVLGRLPDGVTIVHAINSHIHERYPGEKSIAAVAALNSTSTDPVSFEATALKPFWANAAVSLSWTEHGNRT